MATAFLAMFGPLLFAVFYWYIRYVLSRIPTWEARILENRKRRFLARAERRFLQAQVEVELTNASKGRAEEGTDGGAEGEEAPPSPAGEQEEEEQEASSPPQRLRRRRRMSLINALTDSIAEKDVKEDLPGLALRQLHRRFAEAVADSDGLATYEEFTKLVDAAAPSAVFIDEEWEDRKDKKDKIGFNDFRVVMKNSSSRRYQRRARPHAKRLAPHLGPGAHQGHQVGHPMTRHLPAPARPCVSCFESRDAREPLLRWAVRAAMLHLIGHGSVPLCFFFLKKITELNLGCVWN
jgi:hypothetical protein